ncbi:hypothetical protein [Haloarcula sp. CBA1127]|uniref:hypothetical protein n=1 Tax=Haloarcula sp. CBA1127 TaxID=1765055 RepID=UPI00073EA974|nr:hypothetical protein [Haloarcula sp. CBA1127]
MSGPNVDCPQCGGQLQATNDPESFRCRSCDRELRQVVLENLDSFRRVAESDGPAAEIAAAALEGTQ